MRIDRREANGAHPGDHFGFCQAGQFFRWLLSSNRTFQRSQGVYQSV
jgi:hypothetical protein